MNILYLSFLASETALNDARAHDPKFASFGAQKFNKLVVEGLAKNGHKVKALSSFYLPRVGFGYFRHSENYKNVQYHYIFSPNYPVLRHLWITIYCFFYVLFWGLINTKNKVLMADVLNISANIGSLFAARIIGLRRVGIMTDMPGLLVDRNNSIKSSKMKWLCHMMIMANKSYLYSFTHYVFLTDYMNKAINKKNRPYIIMEGLVDSDYNNIMMNQKDSKHIVLYAGGLHERYGLKLLVDGFIKADLANSELWLLGSGSFVDTLYKNDFFDSRVKYKGVLPNKDVVEMECIATLLVNPRPTHEEFTKYSFPSKNMEYMLSGTPVLTTRLPGMPKEYESYVFLFDSETVDGYASTLKDILSLSRKDLEMKGAQARDFVLLKKNNVSQTARIVEMLMR